METWPAPVEAVQTATELWSSGTGLEDSDRDHDRSGLVLFAAALLKEHMFSGDE